MPPSHPARIEYLTIIAPSAGEAMSAFRARRLGELGYSILGKIGRHSVAIVGLAGREAFIDCQGMVAATFQRVVESDPADQ